MHGHRDGIYLEFNRHALVARQHEQKEICAMELHFMFSDSCAYEGNTFRNNGSGVAVMYSRFVRMTDNHFLHNWGAAAYGCCSRTSRTVTWRVIILSKHCRLVC